MPFTLSSHSLVLLLIIITTISLLTSLACANLTTSGAGLGSSFVEIIEPASLKGIKFPSNLATFSLVPPDVIGLEAYVVLADPITACSPLRGETHFYKDSIVLVERGDCQFIDKAHQVENSGAISFIISNVVDSIIPIPIANPTGAPPDRYLPLVGSAILGRDGNFIKTLVKKGVPVRLKIVAETPPRVL